MRQRQIALHPEYHSRLHKLEENIILWQQLEQGWPKTISLSIPICPEPTGGGWRRHGPAANP
jgi:hypothetical protein